MTRRSLHALAITIAVLAISSAQLVADESELFHRLDQNQDGKISRDEIKTADQLLIRRLMRTADKDHDGTLSPAELKAGTTTPDQAKSRLYSNFGGSPQQRNPGNFDPRQIFTRLDRNGDGGLTRQESGERMRQRFEFIDTDGNGKIELAEFVRIISMSRQPTVTQSKENTPKSATPDNNSQADVSGRKLIALFRRLDADSNGRITIDEIPESRRAEFKQYTSTINPGQSEGVSLQQFMTFRRSLEETSAGTLPKSPANPNTQPANPFAAQLRKADRDGNGTISKAEAPQRLRENFERIDKDGNGELDSAELRRAYLQFRSNSG